MRQIDADALMECFKGWIEEYNLSPAYVRAIIDEMPTIAPKTGRWIPVTERLPKDDTRVITWMAWGGFSMLDYQYGHFYGLNSVNEIPNEAISAWMPLPEPYKEEVEK